MGGKLVLDQSTRSSQTQSLSQPYCRRDDNYSCSLGSQTLTNIIIIVIVIFFSFTKGPAKVTVSDLLFIHQSLSLTNYSIGSLDFVLNRSKKITSITTVTNNDCGFRLMVLRCIDHPWHWSFTSRSNKLSTINMLLIAVPVTPL